MEEGLEVFRRATQGQPRDGMNRICQYLEGVPLNSQKARHPLTFETWEEFCKDRFAKLAYDEWTSARWDYERLREAGFREAAPAPQPPPPPPPPAPTPLAASTPLPPSRVPTPAPTQQNDTVMLNSEHSSAQGHQ